MGCCENRDVNRTQTNEKTPIASTGKSPKSMLPRSPGYPSNSVNWDQFIDAKNREDIKALVGFIHSTERAKAIMPQRSEWVAPTTVGGHAMCALADACKKRPGEVSEEMRNDLHKIVEYIDSRNNELQEPSLILLYSLSSSLSPSLKDRVANVGGFTSLLRIMRTGSSVKRQIAADTCCVLYCGSEARKAKFIALGGVTTLVHVMNLDKDNKELVHRAIERFAKLIEVTCSQADKEGEGRERLTEMVKVGVVEAIGTLDLNQVFPTQLDQVTIDLIEKVDVVIQSVRKPQAL